MHGEQSKCDQFLENLLGGTYDTFNPRKPSRKGGLINDIKSSLSANRKGSVGRRLCRKPLRDMPAGARDRDGSIGISWAGGRSAGRPQHREVGIKIRVSDLAES